MPFHDLNVAYNPDHAVLSNTLSFARELGYDTVALAIALTDKIPSELPALSLSNITVPAGLRVLKRLTLTISDTTQNHRLSSLNLSYDILALRPTDEKTLQLCCLSLECDLISLDLTQRLPFLLKFKTVAAALQRGVRFEICYSPGISTGSDARRNLISGATQLIRASRSRGIVLSSDAKSALGLRGPWDVMNLAQVWGLPQQRAKEGICEETGKVVRLAGLKRSSFRGVVDIVTGGAETQTPRQDAQSNTVQNVLEKSVKNTTSKAANKPSVNSHNTTGTKRKASENSAILSQEAPSTQEKPISKREIKRRAKKARLEKIDIPNTPDPENGTKPFLITHESLKSKELG